MEGKKVIKIKVTAGGDITADGQSVSLEQLATKLADLKQAGGECGIIARTRRVRPHPNAMKAIAVTGRRQQAPDQVVSAKPDFSDAVNDKGESRPGGR